MFKFLNPFKKPPAKVFAKNTLEEYSHHYVISQEASEYHAKMADFYKQGMIRMQGHLLHPPALSE
jgi:hypothetical protein